MSCFTEPINRDTPGCIPSKERRRWSGNDDQPTVSLPGPLLRTQGVAVEEGTDALASVGGRTHGGEPLVRERQGLVV